MSDAMQSSSYLPVLGSVINNVFKPILVILPPPDVFTMFDEWWLEGTR